MFTVIVPVVTLHVGWVTVVVGAATMLTVIVVADELASTQKPLLLTTARYCWLLTAFVTLKVVVVFAISVHDVPLFVDVCHLVTEPV